MHLEIIFDFQNKGGSSASPQSTLPLQMSGSRARPEQCPSELRLQFQGKGLSLCKPCVVHVL